jgi:hypothetical protein
MYKPKKTQRNIEKPLEMLSVSESPLSLLDVILNSCCHL